MRIPFPKGHCHEKENVKYIKKKKTQKHRAFLSCLHIRLWDKTCISFRRSMVAKKSIIREKGEKKIKESERHGETRSPFKRDPEVTTCPRDNTE